MHTLGKWEAEHHRSEHPALQDDPGYWTVEGQVMPSRSGVVGDTLNRDFCISPDEDRDNARLFAAAPDMLEALQRLKTQMTNVLLIAEIPDRFADSFNDAQRQADAAIFSATGEPQP